MYTIMSIPSKALALRTLHFIKYHGCGNDFIFIDNRSGTLSRKSASSVAVRILHRRFGIGGDGLILLETKEGDDLEMVYYNNDGSVSAGFCGNGARCFVAFARFLGVIELKTRFVASDGPHQASIIQENQEMGEYFVELDMNNVLLKDIKTGGNGEFILNTGAPHAVQFVDDLETVDVFQEGSKIRYSEFYRPEGINVNFVQVMGEVFTHPLCVTQSAPTLPEIKVATYERGTEYVTFACGTGSVASAIAHCLRECVNCKENTTVSVPIETKGGRLHVRFKRTKEGFENVKLIGPAVQIFQGEMLI